jgi:hypothetical protein
MALTKPRIQQIDSNVSAFSDPITVINSGAYEPDSDVGFLINRANGLVSNVALYWNELGNTFVVAHTSDIGGDANITVDGHSNFTAGNIYTTFLHGNGSAITALSASSIIGVVSSASYATESGLANTVNSSIQSNITTLGNLTNLTVVGNITTGGNVVVAGNLQVDGQLTYVNSTNLDVTDKNITVAKGSINSAAANGAGLTVDGAGASIVYTSITDSWNFNKTIIGGNIYTSGLYWESNSQPISSFNLFTDTFDNELPANSTSTVSFVGQAGANVIVDSGTNTVTVSVIPGASGLTADYGLITDPIGAIAYDFGSL